jgi:long-chain acyl-CoA synthetase
MAALEARYDEFKKLVTDGKEQVGQMYSVSKEQIAEKMEEIKRELVTYVNSKVNRFSQITKVIDNGCEFEKTPTKKIRRFVYEQRAKNGFVPDVQ